VTSHCGAFVQPLLQWKSSEYYIFWGCVCILRYPACKAHAPYCDLWPAPLYSIFLHYLINGTIFEKKNIVEHKLCDSMLATSSIWNIFHYKKNWARLSDFNENWFFSTAFKKILEYKISWKSVQRELFDADWRTDMKLIIAFRSFTNVTKNGILRKIWQRLCSSSSKCSKFPGCLDTRI